MTQQLASAMFVPNTRVNESGDAAASTATTAVASVGQEFWGTLGTRTDQDWIRVELEAGETYVFTVWGTNGSANGVDDTILTLYDASGVQIDQNDDVNAADQTYFSRVTYTPSSNETVYLGVESYDSSEAGDYILEVATNVFTIDQIVNQLAEHGWGIPAPIAFGDSSITVDLTALTAAGQQLARWALEMWESMTTLEFTEVSSNADITFDDADANGAYARLDDFDSSSGELYATTVNIGTNWINRYGTQIGSYSFLTYLHEIGHALGLGHGGAYDGAATYGVDNHYVNDSYQATIMSYFDLVDNTYVDGSDYLPVTPMIADIAAVWQLYGTPTDVNSGNTTWGANSNVGGLFGTLMGILFDGDADTDNIFNGDLVGLTIVDTGGTDTVDLSTVSADQIIDLNEGGISDIAGYEGNAVVSLGSEIENAIGGSGIDQILGNDLNNSISGADGADIIRGAEGADLIFGGAGDDTIFGGRHADAIESSVGNDVISGDGGYDSIRAGSGDDTVFGGKGRDTVWLGNGDDVFEDGTDLNNRHSYDTVYGGKGHDTISGGGGADRLFGGADADEIYGGLGADRISGGSGYDLIRAGQGNDLVYGGNGNDTVYLDGGNDRFVDVAQDGRHGQDTVYGGWGSDTIVLSGGDDVAFGGVGADTFEWDAAVFAADDTVGDFEDGTDTLSFVGIGFGDVSVTDAGADTLVTWANGSVTLTGIDHTLITVDDFQFV